VSKIIIVSTVDFVERKVDFVERNVWFGVDRSLKFIDVNYCKSTRNGSDCRIVLFIKAAFKHSILWSARSSNNSNISVTTQVSVSESFVYLHHHCYLENQVNQ
jgi:hypothetical protein